jgi:hypothetical protein
MSDENRIRVRMQDELTPVRREERVDLNAEIKVDVDSHLKGLAVAGLAAIGLGTILLLAGAIMFTLGYPETYHGCGGACIPESHTFILWVVELLAAGIILLFVGTSSFFYGRTVLGSGHLDQFSTQEIQVGPPGAAGGAA